MQIGNTFAASAAANQASVTVASVEDVAARSEGSTGPTDTKVTLSKEALDLLAAEQKTSETPPPPVITPFNGGGTEPPDPPNPEQ